MGNLEDDEEKKEEPKIQNPCDDISVEVHNRVLVETPISIVKASGESYQIGMAYVCVASVGKLKNICNHIEHKIRIFKSWPPDLTREGWDIIAVNGQSYWSGMGFNIAKTGDGKWHNFNDLACVPPFNSPDDLKPNCLRMLRFRSKHDPNFPDNIRAALGVAAPADVESLVENVVESVVNKHRPEDGYQPGMDDELFA